MSSLLVFLENVSLSAGRAHAIYFELGFSHALLEQRFHGAVVLGVLFHEPPFINADLCVKDGTQDRRLRLQDRRESPVIGVKRKSQDCHHLVQGHVYGPLQLFAEVRRFELRSLFSVPVSQGGVLHVEELQRALDFPWEKWTVFLHPEQRQLVERHYTGPARVAGSAGTGKTIVALHRAAHLARTHSDARVLLTTFSDTLANALQTKLRRLLGNEPRLAERIDVYSLNAIGLRLYKSHIGQATIARHEIVRELLQEAASAVGGHKFSLRFLLTEWEQVVDAWQLDNWEAYRDVVRLGRKTRIPEAQRTVLWSVFELVRAGLKARQLITHAQLFSALATSISKNKNTVFCCLGGRSAKRSLFRG
jgi:hypothetical protein